MQRNEYTDLTVDAVSSLADTWIRLSNDEWWNQYQGHRIVKSRGMGRLTWHQNLLSMTTGFN
jgi:hypothetical protein